MEITEEHRSRLEEVMTEIHCQKGFECYTSDFEKLGKIGGIKANGLLECLEQNSQDCPFSLSFGDTCSCLCPLRIYIATEFER
ncbi:MAG: hypothetical protein ACYTEQ_03750 [Planctomycetota bacterium]|jgi:hypothetical protein